MSFEVVADLETPHEALLARGLLRAHGIPAETTADRHVFPGTVTGRVSGTGVVVPAADAEEARLLLGTTESGPDPAWSSPEPPLGPASPDPASPRPASHGAPEHGSASSGPPPLVASTGRPRGAVIAIVGLIALVIWLVLELAGAL